MLLTVNGSAPAKLRDRILALGGTPTMDLPPTRSPRLTLEAIMSNVILFQTELDTLRNPKT